MDYQAPPLRFNACTAHFSALAARPFDGVFLSNLAAIHQPGVNLVTGNDTFSPQARERLAQLDVMALALQQGTRFGSGPKFGLFDLENVVPQNLLSTIGPALERILPPHKGNEAVARDLARMFGGMAQAYDNSPLDIGALANLPGSQGLFHRDNFTEHRGLITLPTNAAVQGTLVLDEFAKDKALLALANPQANEHKGPAHNNYGRPTALWNHLIREAPVGQMLIWHGEETGHARIHSEPDVLTPEQARIAIKAVPTAMAAREKQRAQHHRHSNSL